jgi:Carboxypeptidase regulatory-like domain
VRKTASITILALTFSLILIPVFFLDVNAMGCRAPGCQLETITHVPNAEHTINVKVDGSAIFPLNHTFTFANATTHTIQVLDTAFIGAQTGKHYTFKQWTYVGDGSQWDSSPTMTTPPMYGNYTTALCSGTFNCPFLAEYTITPALGCNSNCHLQALTTVAPADGTIKVKVDGGTVYSLGQIFPFANGTVHTIQVLNNSFTGASTGATYIWKQWSCTCGIAPSSSTTLTTPTMYLNYTNTISSPENGVGAFTAEFDELFQLTLSFKDPTGNPISSPNSITLTSGTSSLTITSYSGLSIPAKLWTLADVTWEGVSGLQVASQSIDLTNGPVTAAIQVKAYSATVKTVDAGNNPISGVTITVTMLNSTVKSFTTDSQGLAQIGYLPNGRYTAHVTYHGSDAGTWTTDASTTPVLTVTVASAGGGSGLTSTTVVSAVVLLTVFGIAAFLIILGVRVRKPPAPPSIE